MFSNREFHILTAIPLWRQIVHTLDDLEELSVVSDNPGSMLIEELELLWSLRVRMDDII